MAIVGSATMTLSSSGLVLSAVYGGSGVSLSYVQNRGPQFLSVLNAALAAAAAAGAAAQPPFTSIPATASSILFPSLAGYQAQANQLCTQCFDDATAIVPYLNASGGITTVLWDGAAVANSPGTAIVNVIGAQGVSYDATLSSIDIAWTLGMPVTRGLTFSLLAATGVTAISGKGPYWRDQAPSSVGRSFQDAGGTGGGATIGTSINGFPTLDFVGLSGDVRYQDPNSARNDQLENFSPHEFSIAAVVKYTGAINMNTSTLGVIPAIVADGSGTPNPPNTVGLSCGLDPSNSGMVQFAAHAFDGSLHTVLSADTAVTSGHYVIVTFGAGTLSIYVDALSVVNTTGIGNVTNIQSGGKALAIGSNGISGNSALVGSILYVGGWNVCLTATEIGQAKAWLKSVSGL